MYPKIIYSITLYLMVLCLNCCSQLWWNTLLSFHVVATLSFVAHGLSCYLLWFRRNMVCNHFWDYDSKLSSTPLHILMGFDILLWLLYLFWSFSNLNSIFSFLHSPWRSLDAPFLLSKFCCISSLVLFVFF
jgi:hypothetical protein